MRKNIFSGLLAMLILLGAAWPVFGESSSNYISGGWNTTFYITKDGSLMGYGKNAEGLLLGSESKVVSPKYLLSDVKSVAANRYSVLAIKKDNSLWFWGSLGSETSEAPKKRLDNVVMVSNDDYYKSPIMILKGDGTAYLHDGKSLNAISHGSKVKFVVTSGSRHYFINEKDELWGYCDDKSGSAAMGVGAERPVLTPEKIMDDVQYVSADNSNTMMIRKDGTLWMCGSGYNGNFFNGTSVVEAPVLSPVKIMDNVMQTAMRDGAFYAVKKDNTLWAWGDGINSSKKSDVPFQYANNVAAVWAATGHVIVAKTDNTLWVVGKGEGVVGDTKTYGELQLVAQNLIDSPAPWAMVEVREAEYRKLVPPAMQSDYTKIVTRNEFCTLAITCIEQAHQMTIEQYLASKGMAIPESTPFTDVNGLSERDRKDIEAAYALEIVSGTSPTTFNPLNQITREQAAKMLTATATALGKETKAEFPAFSDGNNVSNWAKPYIGYVYNAKIMSGVGNNRFDPLGGYQRQQAYMTMLRLYKQFTGM